MTPRPHRLRKALKWLATTLALLIVVSWPLSRWWMLAVVLPNQQSIAVVNGGIFADIRALADPVTAPKPGIYLQDNLMSSFGMPWQFRRVTRGQVDFVMIPLWMPLALLLPPVILLWRRDLIERRWARIDRCANCGYDRRGIDAASPCPECGVTKN